jgi:hypothetical protein
MQTNSVWKAAQSGDKTYYYNTVTLETSWKKPPGFDNVDISLATSAVQDAPYMFYKWASINIELFIHTNTTISDPNYRNNITGNNPTLHDVQFYCDNVLYNLFIYPTSLLQQIKLTKIVLVSNLALTGQKRRAIPNYYSGILYLDCTTQSTAYLISVMQHELFHMIDHAMCNGKDLNDDPDWNSLNVSSFTYGNGGAYNRNNVMWTTASVQGFLNHYSITAIEEDKAEIFAALVMHPRGILHHNDQIIQNKGKEIQRRLAVFCSEMNHEWWESRKQQDQSNTTRWTQTKDKKGIVVWKNDQGGHSYRDPVLFQ